MNAAVTISRCELLSGRDAEPNLVHPLAEEDLVLVPGLEDSLLVPDDKVVPILNQELLTGRRGNCKRNNEYNKRPVVLLQSQALKN